MPHLDAPSGASFVPEAAMIPLEPPLPALGASNEGTGAEGTSAPLATGPLEAASLASGPYRIVFGCCLEPASTPLCAQGRVAATED